MTFGKSSRPVVSGTPKKVVYAGNFAGADGVNPTVLTVDPGITVTRTGEGVWAVLLPRPVAGFKAVTVTASDDDGAFHDVAYTTSGRTITITHRTCTYATIVSAGPVVQDVVDKVAFIAVVEESDVPGAGV